MFKHFIPYLLIVLVLAVSGVSLYNKNNTITNLETKLETQDKTYSGRIDELTDYQQSLVVQLNELTSQNTELKNKATTLQSSYDELVALYDEKVAESSTKDETIAELNAAKTNLFEQIASLQATIDEQQETIDNMVSDLNSDLNTAFIDGSITTLTAEDFEGVTSIRPYAFRNCLSLVSVEIPSSVKTVGEYAFSYCSALSVVKVNALYIEQYAFADGRHIKTLEIGRNVSYIGNDAFYYGLCVSEEDITLVIPNSLGTISEAAFNYSTIKTIIFEGCPAQVYGNAFENAFELEQIVVPDVHYNTFVGWFNGISNSNYDLSITNLSEIVIKYSDYVANSKAEVDSDGLATV